MRTLFYSILSVTLLFGFSGCSSLEKIPNPFSGVKQEPRQSVAVWSPAARVVDGVPERGFAARVTFFGNDMKKGVKINGDVVVFAFEEYPYRSAGDNRPDQTYPFLAEDMKKLHSYSKKLGHSYSLWVPWDNEGPDGERKTVSLIVKYVPKNGHGEFLSGQAKCVLPGQEPSFMAHHHSYEEGRISQVHYRFGRNDRYDEQLPPGFRDWATHGPSPEEREIRTTNNRPTHMVKTSIPISGNAYSAIMQNNPVSTPVEPVVAQNPVKVDPQPPAQVAQIQTAPTQVAQTQIPPEVSQSILEGNILEGNPITPASYNWQPYSGLAPLPPQNFMPQYPRPALPNMAPQPTDFAPAPRSSNPAPVPERIEQQGNTTITYSNVGTNPLSRGRL